MRYLLKDEAEEGQGLVEYALIIALISLAVFAMVMTMGGGLIQVYQNKIVSSLSAIGM